MLHLLSVITAAAILAVGVGFLSAEPSPKNPTRRAETTNGRVQATPPSRDIPPAAEGRSVETDTYVAPLPDEDEEDDGLAPED